MAEGLVRSMAGDRFEVFSAGTKPLGLNPSAVTVMSEIGIDISGYRSKPVDAFSSQQFDYVITVCDTAKETCPVFSGSGRRLHHSFPDPASAPAEEQPEVFRVVREQMFEWFNHFVTDADLGR